MFSGPEFYEDSENYEKFLRFHSFAVEGENKQTGHPVLVVRRICDRIWTKSITRSMYNDFQVFLGPMDMECDVDQLQIFAGIIRFPEPQARIGTESNAKSIC